MNRSLHPMTGYQELHPRPGRVGKLYSYAEFLDCLHVLKRRLIFDGRALTQEVRKWCSWQFHPCCCSPGARLQLRTRSIRGWVSAQVTFSLNPLIAALHLLPDRRRLVNPYVQPVLYVRRPGNDHEEVHRFPDDDPFFSEVGAVDRQLLPLMAG